MNVSITDDLTCKILLSWHRCRLRSSRRLAKCRFRPLSEAKHKQRNRKSLQIPSLNTQPVVSALSPTQVKWLEEIRNLSMELANGCANPIGFVGTNSKSMFLLNLKALSILALFASLSGASNTQGILPVVGRTVVAKAALISESVRQCTGNIIPVSLAGMESNVVLRTEYETGRGLTIVDGGGDESDLEAARKLMTTLSNKPVYPPLVLIEHNDL